MPPQSDARKAQIQSAVERQRERLRSMPPLAAAAWKARKTLGDADLYTPAEREWAEALRARLEALEQDAAALHAAVLERIAEGVDRGDPLAVSMGKAMDGAKALRMEFLF